MLAKPTQCTSLPSTESDGHKGAPGEKKRPPVEESVAHMLEVELEHTRAWMGEWIGNHRRLYEEHVSQQECLLRNLVDAQSRALQHLRYDLGCSHSTSATYAGDVDLSCFKAGGKAACASSPKEPEASREGLWTRLPPPVERDDDVRSLDTDHSVHSLCSPAGFETSEPWNGPTQQASTAHDQCAIDAELRELHKCDHVLNLWKRTSGLQTVMHWVSDYHKHEGGWATLLMIHGVPEVTARLRNKVENYAIYSALFLSMSITLLADKPEFITTCEERLNYDWHQCATQLRVYFYGLMVGIASHLLSIFLAMAFLNALNEAPRDADVYRMFQSGHGFLATVRCQNAFRLGCIADLLSVLVSVTYHLGWEAVVVGSVLFLLTVFELRRRGSPLFHTASVMRYWRTKPHADDPFDLEVPVGIFQECAEANRRFFLDSRDRHSDRGRTVLWQKLRRTLRASAGITHQPTTPPDKDRVQKYSSIAAKVAQRVENAFAEWVV